MVYGAALMAVMMYAPEGLYWRVRNTLRTRRAGAGDPIRSVPVPAASVCPLPRRRRRLQVRC